MSWKVIYGDQWAKAAKNCEQVIGDLTAAFYNDGLKLRAGHGALSCEEDNAVHDHGEPDIFLLYKDTIIGGIEVTGSNRVSWPCEVWVGHHKMLYANKVFFPVAFVLFYKGERRFVTAQMVNRYSPSFQEKTVYGTIEHYHVLKPHNTQPYSQMLYFVEGCLDFAKREEFQREINLGVPWE